ncbi:MAG: repeat-associated core domain protein [Neobacillus sp.]|nr:repeat-associated core domain protein [Neobacillus sp.]
MNKRNKFISWLVISCFTLTSLSFQPAYASPEKFIAENEIHTEISKEGGQMTNIAEEADITPPVLNNANINGNILTLYFNEELDKGSSPLIDDFTILISSGEVFDRTALAEIDAGNDIYTIMEDTIYSVMADTTHISQIDIYDNKAVLIIDNMVNASDAITLSYDPSVNLILDVAGNPMTPFSSYVVDNITGGKGLPNFVVEKIYSELDTVSFSRKFAEQIYYGMIDFRGTKDELRSLSADIVNILASTTSYSNLSEENKSKLIRFFGIDDTFFTYYDENKETIEQTLLMHSKLEGIGLTEIKIDQAMKNDEIDEIILEKEEELLDQANQLDEMGTAIASTSEDPFADVKYDPEKILGAPFKHNSFANEQINLGSGALAYNVTDVMLPGAGGLDLVIERQYNTDQSNYYDIDAALYYGKATNGNFLYSKMNTYRRMKNFEINADGTMGDSINTTSWSLFDDNYTIQAKGLRAFYSMKEIAKESDRYSASLYKKETTTSNTNVMARQITNPVTKNEEMWQLGAGWKLNFSYVEIYSAYFSSMKVLHLADGREFSVSSNWVNNLGHYTYKDVIFKNESTTVGGQLSSYSITYADGKKEYFNSDGRLIAIVDRFGNTISIAYAIVNNKVEMQITDTLGRIITFTNQSTSTGFNKILTLPGGKTITYVLEQNEERTIDELGYLEDFNGEFNEYNLVKVINQVGEETLYEYTDTQCGTDFAARYRLSSTKKFMGVETWEDGDQYYPNYYAGLTKITYPTGFTVNYEYFLRYNNWYDYGCMTDIAIKTRYDNLPSRKYSEKQYNYSYRYGGPYGTILYNADTYNYELNPNNPFDEFQNWWVTETDPERNIIMRYEFDRTRGFCVKEETFLGSVLVKQNSNDYRRFNLIQHPSKSQITTKRYDTSDGQVLTTIECFDYDDRGNAISYWPALAEGNTSESEYKVAMTYDATYNFLTGKTYKRDASMAINEQNAPSVDGKTIAQSLIYENGILKAKTDYLYDAFGNVTKSKEYTNLTTGAYNETDYGYANGAYLADITVLNVINADGINTGSISRQATYDSYGRILKETDAKSNITSYTYDDIGRITQIVYPDSVAKSFSYNTGLNQTTVTDERGFVTRYKYDPAGNLTELYSMNGSTATLLKANEYDNLYRMTSEKNNLAAGGSVTTYSYDHKDRVIRKSVKNVSSQVLSNEGYRYFDDKMIKTIEGDSNSKAIITTEYLDKYGRVTKQGRFIDDAEKFNTFVYNYLGEMLQEKSARANSEGFTEPFTTKYEHDFAGNIKKQYDVLGNFTTTAYDAAGRKISVTDAKSNVLGGSYSTLYTYDALGRLTKEEVPFAASVVAVTKYYYDANGNLVQKQITNGQPGSAATFSKVEYAYNNKDRLTQVKSYNGAVVASQVDYEYDPAGNMTAMVTGNGTQRTTYGYDRYGNMISLIDPLGMEEAYAYDINGNMISKIDKKGNVTAYTYDGLSRKLSQSVTVAGVPQMELWGYTATGALAFAQNTNILILGLTALMMSSVG